MRDEMHDEAANWRKAIPRDRDRRQSLCLVAVVGSLLVGLTGWTMLLALPAVQQFPGFVFGALGISMAFAALVVVLKAATPAGAMCGGMVCLLLIYWTGGNNQSLGRTAVTPLAMLFVLTFLSTRAGRRRKAKAGLAESRKGRTAAQVIANLGFAALCVNPWMAEFTGRWMGVWNPAQVTALGIDWTIKVMCLAALVEATADTVSSEIGQAFGGAPVMLLTLKRVAAGTDGAITLLGTVAGIAGGTIVAITGVWAMQLDTKSALVVELAGTLGLFFDSLLGATVERRGWLGNDLVNFTSTAFAALIAMVLYCHFAL